MERDRNERLRLSVEQTFLESIRVKEEFRRTSTPVVVDMALMVVEAFREKRCLYLFGNGGSAADAQHIAAEFVNRFQINRDPLPAVALTVDSSVLTSIGNDFHFDDIFVKQLRALAHPGDVALGISTSGRSPNVLKALEWARGNGVRTIGLAGPSGAEMDRFCDIILHVPSKVTARIQECHITAGHAFCALVEDMLFGEESHGEI